MSLLSTQEELLENVLGCVPVGQIITVKPLSEDFCYVLGYLLTWKLILTFFKAASSQVSKYWTFGGWLGVMESTHVKALGGCIAVFLKAPSFRSERECSAANLLRLAS